MISTTRSTVIAAPRDAVWRWVCELDRLARFYPLVARCLSPAEVTPGGSGELEFKVGDRSFIGRAEIVAVDPGVAITWRWLAVGGKSLPGVLEGGTSRYELAPEGTGTRATVTISYPAPEGRAKRWMLRAAAEAEGQVLSRALDKLAQLVVSELAGGAAVASSAASAGRDAVEPPAADQGTPSDEPGLLELAATPEATQPSDDDPAPALDLVADPTSAAADEAEPIAGASETPEVTQTQPSDGRSSGAAQDDSSIGPGGTPRPSGDEDGAPQVVMPGPLDADQARQMLMAWASSRPLISAKLFEGPLLVSPAASVRCSVTRLIETRQERDVHVPANAGLPQRPRYNVSIEAIDVPDPADFDGRVWEMILAGSEHQAGCPAGCMSGRVECRQCQGGWKRCISCGGTGTKIKTEYANGRSVQRQERCRYCAGRGQVECRNCQGGWIRCSTCQGAGSVIWFRQGVIQHAPVVERIGGAIPAPLRPKDINDGDWKRALTVPGDGVPTGLPSDLSSQVAAELSRRPQGELLRKLDIDLLAVTQIKLDQAGHQGTAQIVHSSGTIRAEGMRSVRRVKSAVAIAIAVAIAVIAIIALSSSGGSSDSSGVTETTYTGAWVEQELDANLASNSDDAVDDVTCADEPFDTGASISCTVHYASGDTRSLTVTNNGTTDSPSISVDTP